MSTVEDILRKNVAEEHAQVHALQCRLNEANAKLRKAETLVMNKALAPMHQAQVFMAHIFGGSPEVGGTLLEAVTKAIWEAYGADVIWWVMAVNHGKYIQVNIRLYFFWDSPEDFFSVAIMVKPTWIYLPTPAIPQTFVDICADEYARSSVTSLPQKSRLAEAKGIPLGRVEDWMRVTWHNFSQLVKALTGEI